MRLIAVDVETTGLPLKRRAPITDNKNWPYIVQISWLILENDIITKICDYIIRLPDNISIPQDSIDIHGITNEQMRDKGVSMKLVIEEFMNDMNQCDTLIAHNLEFDKKMIIVELYRNGFYSELNKIKFNKLIEVCTMKVGTDICKIEKTSPSGKIYYKYPKLSELHQKLFNEMPDNLHNSLIDMLVCMRCFYKIRFNEDLYSKSTSFHDILTRNTFHTLHRPSSSSVLS